MALAVAFAVALGVASGMQSLWRLLSCFAVSCHAHSLLAALRFSVAIVVRASVHLRSDTMSSDGFTSLIYSGCVGGNLKLRAASAVGHAAGHIFVLPVSEDCYEKVHAAGI